MTRKEIVLERKNYKFEFEKMPYTLIAEYIEITERKPFKPSEIYHDTKIRIDGIEKSDISFYIYNDFGDLGAVATGELTEEGSEKCMQKLVAKYLNKEIDLKTSKRFFDYVYSTTEIAFQDFGAGDFKAPAYKQ